jgi:hypothetical protein
VTLNTYQITAWCDRTFTTSFDVQAESPRQALEIARERAHDEEAEECAMDYPWDTFRICDAENNELFTYREAPDALSHPPNAPAETDRKRSTSATLLDALKMAEGFVQWASDHGADQAATASALAFMRSAVAGGESACRVAPEQRSRFEVEHDPAENSDRVYVLVDGKFDVAIIRTDEGIIVDVYPKEGFDTIASTYAFDSDAEQESTTN